MSRHAERDEATGRFRTTQTSNTSEAKAGDFETYADDFPVGIQGEGDFAYGTEHRYAPAADELAQGGSERLLGRRPVMASPEITDANLPDMRALDRFDGGQAQNRVMRAAAAAHSDIHGQFVQNLVNPMTGPETRASRRMPGSEGTRLPAMGRDDPGQHPGR